MKTLTGVFLLIGLLGCGDGKSVTQAQGGIWGSCEHGPTNPDKPHDCSDFIGSDLDHSSCQKWSTNACTPAGQFGYCERMTGSSWAMVTHYYPDGPDPWDPAAAKGECEMSNGKFTAVP